MKAVDIACHFRWHGNFSDVGKCGGDPPLRQIVGQAEHRVFMIKGTSWVSRLCSREESSFIRSRSFSAVSSLWNCSFTKAMTDSMESSCREKS